VFMTNYNTKMVGIQLGSTPWLQEREMDMLIKTSFYMKHYGVLRLRYIYIYIYIILIILIKNYEIFLNLLENK
jgi:hypothetical protein